MSRIHARSFLLSVTLAASHAAFAQSSDINERRVYNVTAAAFGATPSAGTNDDALGIQAAINAAVANQGNVANGRANRGAIIVLPEGKYDIKSTIVIPYNAYGLEFVGAGAHEEGDWTAQVPGTGIDSTALVAGTELANATVIQCYAGYVKFQDFWVIGSPTNGTATPLTPGAPLIPASRANVLMQFSQDATHPEAFVDGIHFKNVKLKSATFGIRVGISDATEWPMLSDFYFEDIAFGLCKTGFQINEVNALLFHFSLLRAGQCESVIETAKGGQIIVDSATISSCGGDWDGVSGEDSFIFEFRNGEVGNGLSQLNNVRIEQNSRNFVLVNGVSNKLTITNMQDYRSPSLTTAEPASATDAIFDVRAGELTVNDSRFSQTKLVRFASSDGNVACGFNWADWATQKSVKFNQCWFRRFIDLPTAPELQNRPASTYGGVAYTATSNIFAFYDNCSESNESSWSDAAKRQCWLVIDNCSSLYGTSQIYTNRPLGDFSTFSGW